MTYGELLLAGRRGQVACIACKYDIIYLTLSARTDNNHFIDANKMVFFFLSNVSTRFLGFIYYLCEILPKLIKNGRKLGTLPLLAPVNLVIKVTILPVSLPDCITV